MRIGILIAGDTEGELQAQFGSYADMFVELFKQSRYAFSYRCYDVIAGQWPEYPADCDGWIITGSIHGVYDNLPWMEPLKGLIVQIADFGRPLLGICFGHQIIASALGGSVEKAHQGWGLGVHNYKVDAQIVPGLAGLSSKLKINAMHQDQVTALPTGAKTWLSSDFCPHAGFIFNDNVLTFQPHPEFTETYCTEQIKESYGTEFPAEVADQALAQYQNPQKQADTKLIAPWLAGFLLRHKQQRLQQFDSISEFGNQELPLF